MPYRLSSSFLCIISLILCGIFHTTSILGKDKFKHISFGFAVNAKYDFKIKDKIYQVADTAIPSQNLFPVPESGMKAYPLLLPEFRIQCTYKLNKNIPFSLITAVILEKRGQHFKEYYYDNYNEYESIKYIYSFIDFGLGINYILGRFEFNSLFKFKKQISSKITYDPKNGSPFIRNYPTFHWMFTHDTSFELGAKYNLIYKSRLYPSIGISLEPWLHDTKMYSISIGIYINII